MPFFVGDFFAGTALWKGPERGLYLQMLALQWVSGALPADLDRLATALHYGDQEFRKLWATVRHKFEVRGDVLINARLEEHRERGREIAASRSKNGRLGGLASTKANRQASHVANGSKNLSKNQPSDPIRSDPVGSDPIRERESARENRDSDLTDDEEDIFERVTLIRSKYPRAAREDWITAEKRMRELVLSGEWSWTDLEEGVERYAAHCRATNRMVLNPARFFGDVDQPWSQLWPIPPSKADARLAGNIEVLKDFVAGGKA